ncbi:MAG: glycosyl hydrolase family 28 protein [Acidobacteriaceae bacterium]|jgi:polygalacturonase
MALLLFAAGCAGPHTATPGHVLSISGSVHGGQAPVTDATIQLYTVGTTGDGSPATPLLTTTVTTSDGSQNTTNSNANAGNSFNMLSAGSFTITGDYSCTGSTDVYLVSTGGNPGLAPGTNNPALALMAALGPCSNLSSATNVSVNELTTVGSVAALANYMTSYSAIGSGTADASNLQAAFTAVSEYTDTSQGIVPGPGLAAGSYASSFEIATLGDALSACINSPGGVAGDGSSCGMLFTDTTPAGGAAPTNTIAAALNIVNNPALNTCAIYNLAPGSPPFEPTLSSCPSSWTLPISTLAVTVSGPSTVTIGQTAQYAATVSAPARGATNQSVTWMVNGVAGGNSATGTISSTGLYTPPSTAPSGAVTITAVSVLSNTATGSASVTVVPISVAVSGPANVILGQTGQYSALVTGTTSQAVTWIVNGVAGGSTAQGTISTTGLYMAPASTPPTSVTISAQSTGPPVTTGTIGITVSPTAATYATGDTRTVTQPTYPAACQVLQAQFNTSQRSSPPAAASDDTTRIQSALTACASTGQSVELAPSGTNNAFYSSQLTVSGAGLVIDQGVTLEGNDAYSSKSNLVSITGNNSFIMGPGVVDGRGDLTTHITGTPRLVQVTNVNNFIAYNVTLQQAAHPNLYIQGGNGATVWGVTILTPATRANADGIDLDSLTNATVTNSTIEAGDDGVAVKDNNAATSNVTVTNNRLYGTHGLSIGSVLGYTVSNVLFLNNYVYGTDLVGNVSADANGLVVKQKPACASTVTQVTYQNTCMTGVKHLITFYTNYSTSSSCTSAGSPVFNNILVNGVLATQSISGAYSYFYGYSSTAPSSASLANISLDSNSLGSGSTATQYATISLDNSSITPTGTGVTTNTFSTAGSVPTCSF